MTFEERIDRLTERHEALAQSVELNSQFLEQLGKRMDQVSRDVAQTNKTVDVLVLSVQDLVGIVRSHEARLNQLEGQ